jgi:hypothetical protein
MSLGSLFAVVGSYVAAEYAQDHDRFTPDVR